MYYKKSFQRAIGLLVGVALFAIGGILIYTGYNQRLSSTEPGYCSSGYGTTRVCLFPGQAALLWGLVLASLGLIVIGSIIYFSIVGE